MLQKRRTISIAFQDVCPHATAVARFAVAALNAVREIAPNATYVWLCAVRRFFCAARHCYCVCQGYSLAVDLAAETVVVVRRAKDMAQRRRANRSLLSEE